MAATMVRMEGTEVAREGPEKTTINITLRQESGLAYLCKGVAALAGRKAASKDAKDAGQAPRARRPAGGEQKVLGGVQILLGAVCIGLGVVLRMTASNGALPYYYNWSIYNGVPFWMGSLFILSGTFSVVGARCGGYWVHLATFLHLGSVVAGSVAFTMGLTEFAPLTYEPYFIEELCKHRAEDRDYHPWEGTTIPPYDERDQQRASQCHDALLELVRMWSGTQILLLIVHIVAMATALFCFGYGLRRLCCSCWVHGGKAAELPAPVGTGRIGSSGGQPPPIPGIHAGRGVFAPAWSAWLSSLRVLWKESRFLARLSEKRSRQDLPWASPRSLQELCSPTFLSWWTSGEG